MRKDEEKPPVSLEMLTQHLEEVKRLQPKADAQAKPPGDAARSAIDFATASAVGTLLGYGLDVWLDSSPWGLIGGLLIGTGAGIKMMFAAEARATARENDAPKETKETNEQ
jgi:F0F1-type ATP synthase assembly protein I